MVKEAVGESVLDLEDTEKERCGGYQWRLVLGGVVDGVFHGLLEAGRDAAMAGEQ
ncbi:MAG TPA: hypothetical protein VK611_29055 [Acidimicrobiales bacterium]|nr:hypothetical protein [Acidimicrobiales bacterium]